MKWYELRIHTTNEAAEAVSNILHEYTTGGVAIEDPLDISKDHDTSFGEVYDLNENDFPKEGVIVKTYLSRDPKEDNSFQEIQEAVQNLITYDLSIGKGEAIVTEIEEEDWATAWKKFYKPVKISDKIIIMPTWETETMEKNDMLTIEMDPGMAFGTGTHPTTILCIQALEQYVKRDDTVIDVGCGSGVLSIAASLLGAKSIYAYDLDELAISSTKNNASLNNLESVIHAEQNNLLEDVNGSVQIIVSNILAEIIVTFVKDAWKNLHSGGYFITSGIISEKRKLVESELEKAGFIIVEANELDDWVVITAQKPYI